MAIRRTLRLSVVCLNVYFKDDYNGTFLTLKDPVSAFGEVKVVPDTGVPLEAHESAVTF
jgi:hypothetical protein